MESFEIKNLTLISLDMNRAHFKPDETKLLEPKKIHVLNLCDLPIDIFDTVDKNLKKSQGEIRVPGNICFEIRMRAIWQAYST